MSEKSSYWYDSTPSTGTSNSIIWVGGDIPCLNICNNSRLTTVQVKMAEAICNLIAATNVQNIEIPECFKDAFATSNPVLIDFIVLLLNNACTQQNQITEIQNSLQTLNPLVNVDYKCCSDNPCVTTGVVNLNVALENIIQCICSLKETVQYIQDIQIGSITTIAQQALNTSQQANSKSDTNITAISNLSNRMNVVESKINDIINAASVSLAEIAAIPTI